MRVTNKKIHIPKLPSMEIFIKQLNARRKNENLHHIFEQDKNYQLTIYWHDQQK